jgi:hypothetical protein
MASLRMVLKCTFLVNLDRNAALVGQHAGAKGVANNLAPTGDVYGNLQRRRFVSGVWAGSQGAQCYEQVPRLADGDWADST